MQLKIYFELFFFEQGKIFGIFFAHYKVGKLAVGKKTWRPETKIELFDLAFWNHGCCTCLSNPFAIASSNFF